MSRMRDSAAAATAPARIAPHDTALSLVGGTMGAGDDSSDVVTKRAALGQVESGTHGVERSVSGAAGAAGVLRLRERLRS